MISIFCQDAKTVTVRIDGELHHLENHCLLRDKNTVLPPNNSLLNRVGRLLYGYQNKGIGQYGIEGNAFWNRDRLFTDWNDSLIAALYHAPMQYLQVTEEIYDEKLGELPPLAMDCHVYCKNESVYQHRLNFIGGEGTFYGGYSDLDGYYLIGLPESTRVLPWDKVKKPGSLRDGWHNAKSILQIYQK